MKKKILLMLAMTAVLACLLALAVSAGAVHNSTTVDYGATVTLDNGTVCNLFDSERNALIWYLDNDGALQSIRADDVEDGENGKRVVYFVEANRGQTALAKVNIYSGDTIVGHNRNIVVFNIMEDDINFDTNSSVEGIQPMTLVHETFNKDNKAPQGEMKLEYAYLRLDTTQIGGKAFAKCPYLKYVNLENLTELNRIGSSSGYDYGGTFVGCTSLFKNEILDLSKTNLSTIGRGGLWDGNFGSVPISGIKLPSTLTWLASNTFNNCTNLTEIWISGAYTVENEAFGGAINLEKIYYVGTLDEFNNYISKVGTSNNAPFFNVINTNKISYSEYKNLENTSGKYAVYDYSSCAYYGGVHGTINATNACVGVCSVCGDTVVNHTETENLAIKIEYSNYSEEGTKIVTCQNEGCIYSQTEKAPALFTCSGYSAAENGSNGVAIGFKVNTDAIEAYTGTTGKTLKYGVFAVLETRLKDSDIFDKNGTAANGVISAELTAYEFTSFALKIIGFTTDDHKKASIAMGAYVETTKDGVTEYSYMQSGEPANGGKYCFSSYNDIIAELEAKG